MHEITYTFGVCHPSPRPRPRLREGKLQRGSRYHIPIFRANFKNI